MDVKTVQPKDSRKGFEYRYKFQLEDEILPNYEKYLNESDKELTFIVLIRTNFILKRRPENDDMILDKEKYLLLCDESDMKHFWVRRFQDYWMTDDEIRDLVGEAILLAEQRSDQASVICIGMDFDVCTVQQDGEPVDAATDRAITPEKMYPLNLYPENQMKGDVVAAHKFFLSNSLSRIRVGEDADRALMEECPICLRSPTIGNQISRLRCGHVFHNYCIVRWLKSNRSCPMCRSPVYDSKFREICPECPSACG